MLLRSFFLRLFSTAVMMLCAQLAFAQAYPIKTIRFVTYAVGGSNDIAARLIAQEVSAPLGQPMIVDNRNGITIPGEIVAKASPDGYTLFYAGGSFVTGSLFQKIPYDQVRDFSPITMVVSEPHVLVVIPSLSVKSVQELIALAKAKPGQLNFASSGVGGSTHLSAELFKSMTGINIVHIPYSGVGPAVNGLFGGQVQLAFATKFAVLPHVKSGKLVALAITSAKPSPLLPELTTVAAAGVPGFESSTMQGIYAPAKTPTAIIRRLNQEFVRALNSPDVREKFNSYGVEVVGSTPEELGAKLKSDIAKWMKVVKDANIHVDS